MNSEMHNKLKEALPRYVAGGRPSVDTLEHYNAEIEHFFKWCSDNAFEPLKDIDEPTAFLYLDFLSKNGYADSSICLKISAAKTVYFVAQRLGLIEKNPFEYVRPRKPVNVDENFAYFNLDDLKEIYQSILRRHDPTARRDLAIVMLMSVEGLRTVEIHRMSDEDFNWNNQSILIHGKGSNAYIYPCQDSLDVLNLYLETRPRPIPDEDGTPTFIGFSQKFFGKRISRNGIRWSINHVLAAVDKKTKGNSCHTLRHSCGTNLYAETKDLRLVQETLRHADPMTTARYAHVIDRPEERPTSSISPSEIFNLEDF